MDVSVGVISFHRINQSLQTATPSRYTVLWGVLPGLYPHCSVPTLLGLRSHARILMLLKLSANVKLRDQRDGKALPQTNQTRNRAGFPLYFKGCLPAGLGHGKPSGLLPEGGIRWF